MGAVAGTRMGKVLRVFSRRNLIAIVAGVLLAGVPLVVFNVWIDSVVDRHGQTEIGTAAKRALSLANARLTVVVDALDALAAKGAGSCERGSIEAMRRAAFSALPVKEISVVAPDGQTLCTHLGLPLGQRDLIVSRPLDGAAGYTIDVMRIADGPVARLRRKAGTGPNDIAALIPPRLLLPQVSMEGSPISAYAQLATSDGTLIGVTGERPKDDDARFSAKMRSAKYGIEAEIIAPRAMVPAEQIGLKWLGLLIAGAVVLIVAAFVLLIPRRNAGNPVAELQRALQAGEFVPYYQPIVDIRSGQLRGAEVLVRWRKADGSLVLPGSFIPLAESSGLIRQMTHDLMRRVCVQAGSAIGQRAALKISFNFAGQLFSDDSIVKEVRKIFVGSPIKLSQVVLEVTERDPIENFTATRQTIAALQELGIRIAIDDVGTGHSGLSYMLKLGVDIIKIDKMFVDALGTDRNSTTIVETLVDLAHNMRMDVVAEGVENFEQVMCLRDLGVRSAQGYVFAPPLPGSAFLQLVEAIDPLPAAADQAKLGAGRASAA